MYWTSLRCYAVGDDEEEQASGRDLCSGTAGSTASGTHGY